MMRKKMRPTGMPTFSPSSLEVEELGELDERELLVELLSGFVWLRRKNSGPW